MTRAHSQLLRNLLLAFVIVLGCAAASAANVLRGNSARIEAPGGMIYDSALSAKMDMDVYRNRDNSLIFALGTQSAANDVSAISDRKSVV